MKKIFHSIIVLSVWLAFGSTVYAQNFASGRGTSEDPYIVKTIAHLDNIRKYLGPEHAGVYFALGNDLDFANVPNWAPIGRYKNDFYDTKEVFFGKLDGKGYVIRNITIKANKVEPFRVSNIGLFAYLQSGSVIKNLGIENGYMEVLSQNGGFIAGQSGGVIENCYVIGKIIGITANGLGGIVGYLWDMNYSGPKATVKNCHSIVDIETTESMNARVGGIAGYTIAAVVSHCRSLCRLVAERGQEVGGICGTMARSRIEHSHAYGYVKGKCNVGGVLGYQFETNYTTTCYAAVQVKKSRYTEEVPFDYMKESFGGVIGSIYMTLEYIKECYYNKDIFPGKGLGLTSTGLYGEGAVGLTTEEMFKQASFAGQTWDFDTKWSIWEDNTYPYTINTLTPVAVKEAIPTGASGIFDPNNVPEKVRVYHVDSTQVRLIGEAAPDITNGTWSVEFITPVNVSDYVYALAVRGNTMSSPTVQKIKNIYFNGGEGTKTDPFRIATAEQLRNVSFYLGEASANVYFTVENDIDFKNESVWKPLEGSGSRTFFGHLDGQGFALKNVKIVSPDVDSVGLFSVIGHSGNITNLNLLGAVVTGKNITGTICGVNGGTIDNCYVLATINGNDQTGGICGINANTIDHCYAMVTVTGTGTSVGGFCGTNLENASIGKSYAMGKLTGKDIVGGFCGTNAGSLSTVFSGMLLNGSTENGGICAVNRGTIASAYFDKNLAAIEENAIEGVTGLTTVEMKNKNSFAGWNFYANGGDWDIWEDNAYPHFTEQTAPPVITKVSPALVEGICNIRNAPDSIVLYKNYERAGVGIPGLSSWKIVLDKAIQGRDVIYAVAYMAGKKVSRPAFVTQLPNDASLRSLTVNCGKLIPEFSPLVFNYTIKPLGNEVDTAVITALAANVNAKVTGMGKRVLKEGNNKFVIAVISEDASVTANYTITVVRKNADYKPGKDATLKILDVIPGLNGSVLSDFAPDRTEYAASVLNNVSQVMIHAVPNHPYATVTGTGMKNLNEGDNTIVITGLAEDGKTKKNYTIVITRQGVDYVASNDASLQNLVLNEGSLSPAFSSTVYQYSVAVNGAAGEINIMATPHQAGAQVRGAGWQAINIGQNTFRLIVTAEDGVTEQSYQVAVKRDLPSEAELLGITVLNRSVDCSEGTSFNYVAECGVAYADISIEANTGTTVSIDGQRMSDYTAFIPETGYGRVNIVLTSADQLQTKRYELILIRSLPVTIISHRWDNVLAVINNPENNGGYYFETFRWYRDGSVLTGETRPYIRIGRAPAQYIAEMTTADGITISTCPLDVTIDDASGSIVAYPNPVQAGGTLYLKIPDNGKKTADATVIIYNMSGQICKKKSVFGNNPNITMPSRSGMYILKVVNEDGQSETFKILVN